MHWKRARIIKSGISLLMTVAIYAIMAAPCANAQTDFFWNGGATLANPAAGGSGTWSTTDAWRTGTATGSPGTWSAGTTTNAGFLAGTAGTITLGTSGSTNFTGSSLTVQTTGYTITSNAGSRNLVMTGALTIDPNIELTINQNNAGGTWGFGRLTGGDGSSLLFQGIATANNANRINLTGASTTSDIPTIILAGTSAGPTGFVATAANHTLSSNITNNSATSATMLGATDGNSLNFTGQLSGSANLQISAPQAGGAGTVILSGANNYTGDTYLNGATNGVTRIGDHNTLPSGTTVFFGASAGGGTADNGGSIDLNGRDLAVGGLQKTANPNQGIANNTTDLSTLTIGKASGTNTFSGRIGTVTNTNLTTQSNNIALVKTGDSTQILSGVNTYTGSTTVNGGTLEITGSLASPTFTVASGATLTSVSALVASQGVSTINGTLGGTGTFTIGAGATLAGSGTILNDTTISGAHNPGNSPGVQSFGGNLTYDPGSSITWELVANSTADRGINFDGINVAGNLNFGGPTTLNLDFVFTGSTVNWSDSFWTTSKLGTDGWLLFDVAGTTTGFGNLSVAFSDWNDGSTQTFSSFLNGASFSLSQQGSDVYLNFTAVPEPSSLIMVGLAGSLAAAYKSRRRRNAAAVVAAE